MSAKTGPRPSTHCPHCGCRVRNVKTDQITATYREITYICDNCDAQFIAALEVVRMLRPSSMPNPNVRIKFVNYGHA